MDVSHHVNAVQRAVGGRTLDAGEAHVVTLSRSYSTDAADLWDACTNPERLPRWFAPVHGDLRVEGTYQVEGNASGTILSCDPPRMFTATWEFGGAVSWIELRIVDEGAEQSRMQLDHIALVGDGNDRINCSTGTDTVAGNAGTDVIKDAPSEIDESFTFWAAWVDDD